MNVRMAFQRASVGRRRGKRNDSLQGMKRIKVCFIYSHAGSIMKPTKN
jgi:hypothetical protein